MNRVLGYAPLAPGLGLCLLLGACSTRLRVAPPVPPPVHEHVVAAPEESAWGASLAALASLGLAPAHADRARGAIASGFGAFGGNSNDGRTAGIARLAVERDIYRAGRGRLLAHLSPAGPGQTRVKVFADLQARVERRAEIGYARERGRRSPLPLFTAWTTAPVKVAGEEWEALTSNGVLEDEFLDALVSALAVAGAEHGQGGEAGPPGAAGER